MDSSTLKNKIKNYINNLNNLATANGTVNGKKVFFDGLKWIEVN